MMKKKLKKVLSMVVLSAIAVTGLAGCGSGNADTVQQAETGGEISVISREDGSGTRGAFVELFGVEQKNDAGEKRRYDNRRSNYYQ